MLNTNHLKEISTLVIGYIAAPNPTVLDASHMWVSQGVMDEIAKSFAGVIIAVISRFAFAALDVHQKKRRAQKEAIKDFKPEQQTTSLTINKKPDEKEISQ